MSEVLSIAQGEVHPASGQHQIIEWSYDIYTREFECDNEDDVHIRLKRALKGWMICLTTCCWVNRGLRGESLSSRA